MVKNIADGAAEAGEMGNNDLFALSHPTDQPLQLRTLQRRPIGGFMLDDKAAQVDRIARVVDLTQIILGKA
jgi:hypothetical protein